MKRLLFLAMLTGLVLTTPVHAIVVSGSGPGFSIPDATPAGVNSTITFTDNFTITDGVSVTLTGLTHTWVGDITATLIAPDSTAHSLVFRIGRITTGFGDSSNFGGDYTFNDAATGDIWAEATLGTSAYVLRSGSYRTTGADSAAFTSMDSVFTGKSTLGTWTLNMADLAGGDLGTLTGWSLSMNAVPEPGSAALVLCGLTALGFGRRRR